MAYVSASELVLTLPNAVGTITASSTPISISEVATACERAAIELDSAAAAAGYTVPIATTATQAWAQMALWETWGAAGQILRDIFPNSGGANDKLALAEQYRQDFKEILALIRTGQQYLVGAGFDTTGAGRQLARSYSTSNPTATVGVLPNLSIADIF